MYDPDIEDMSAAIDAVTLYEWAIVDGFYGDVYQCFTLQMTVIFNTMYDPDIEDMSEAIDAVTLYEWAIVDGFYGDVY